jgi:mRNA-degrading endonuclease toxin of MazEF toxin-antitoxin module
MLWWLLPALLVFVIAVVIWARRPQPEAAARRPRQPGRTRPPGRPTAKPAPPKRRPAPSTGPLPGEIWWADVPYEDGTGHKVRPCVVLRSDAASRDVLKITSQDQSGRHDHVVIPTRTWDPDADHDSYLDLTGPIRVPVASFEDRAGTLDAATWQKVRRLHGV